MRLSSIRLCLPVLMLSIVGPGAMAASLTDVNRFYTVSIEARNVPYELFVNDIPVFNKTDEASSINSKIYLNPWLIDGRNTFKIRILPVKVSTTDPQDPKFCKVVISGPGDKGKPDAMLAQAEVNPLHPSKDEPFTVALGYPAPAWAQSQKIGKDAATQQKILDKYREFRRLLEKKDLDGIVKFSGAKFKEYAKSMYDPDFESKAKSSLKEEFANPSNELIGIDVQEKNGLRYEYCYGDRLVRIRNDEDRSIIQYYDANEGVTTEYPLFFYFDGKDFVLIL